MYIFLVFFQFLDKSRNIFDIKDVGQAGAQMISRIKQYIKSTMIRFRNAGFYLILAVSLWGAFIRFFSFNTYDVVDLSHNWTDKTGSYCSLSDFHGDAKSDSQPPQRVYYTLDRIAADTAIVFRARSCYADLYVNDVLIREDKQIHSPLYGSSPGSRWHILSLDSSKTPVTLCLEVTTCYTNSRGLIDNIYLGPTQEVYRKIASERIFGFILSAFLYICGIIMVLLYFYMRHGNRAGRDLLYLGLATLFSAQWLASESMLWQLFLGHSEVVHLWGYTALAAIPPSYGMLAVYRLKGRLKTFSIGFSFVGTVSLIVITVLQILGIVDFHYSLVFTRILIVFLIPLMVPLVLSYMGSKQTSQKYIIFPLLGILILSITTSLIKYILGSYNDYSSYVRIALLCFLLCLIVYQFNQIVTTFSKGMKADMLHDLALTDYMTGLYNRTAFNEHVPEYNHIIDSFSPLGIIQFDVNNLKKVNDTLGHEKGDMMIKAVADGLRYAFVHFEKECSSYRTGGDEFLTIINALNADEIYHTCIQRLVQYCEDFNKRPDLDFTLTIAHGYVLIKGGTTLKEAIDEADALMYENKRMLKGLK